MKVKPGWFIVFIAGMLAGMLRLTGPASLADVAAVGYLLTATMVFERGRRTASSRAHVPAPVQKSLQA
jgi:hypothetical protein